MFVIFLSIIAILGAIYALFTKQLRTALGLFIIGIAAILIIPDLTKGLMYQVMGAISMILFVVAVFVLVWQKKEPKAAETKEESEANEENEKK